MLYGEFANNSEKEGQKRPLFGGSSFLADNSASPSTTARGVTQPSIPLPSRYRVLPRSTSSARAPALG